MLRVGHVNTASSECVGSGGGGPWDGARRGRTGQVTVDRHCERCVGQTGWEIFEPDCSVGDTRKHTHTHTCVLAVLWSIKPQCAEGQYLVVVDPLQTPCTTHMYLCVFCG